MANSRSIQILLEGKLFPAWIKKLEALESRSFVSDTDDSDTDSRSSTRSRSGRHTAHAPFEFEVDLEEDTLESVLEVMLSEEAIDDSGHLKLKPIFTMLSPTLQARFLFLLRSNICRINREQLRTFVEKIESHIPLSLWTKEALRQLKNTLHVDCCANTFALPKIKKSKYEFSSKSGKLLEEVLVTTMMKKKEHLSAFNGFLHMGITESAGARPIEESLSTLTSSKAVDVDVIIIDDDSTDYSEWANKASLYKVCEKVTSEKSSPGNQHCDSNAGSVTLVDKTPVVHQSEPETKTSGDVPEFHVSNCHKPESSKIFKTVEAQMMDPNITNNSEKETMSDGIEGEPLKKSRKLNVPSKVIPDGDKLENEERSDQSMCNLPEKVKSQLGNLREICLSKEKKVAISGDMLSCLVRLSKAEMMVACEALELPSLTEKMLINLCDTMPWASLGYEPAVEFLTSCLSSKVMNLESQPSHTLLTVVASVAKTQGQALVHVLVHILHTMNSGEFQCQLIVSVCKNHLPSECFSFLLKQLCTKNVAMNEHVNTVLQTVVDRKPDLDLHSLTHLVTLLSLAPHEMEENAKFGKLLLAIISKYGKKMSRAQVTSICLMVDSHSSSVRKMLLAAVKKISR